MSELISGLDIPRLIKDEISIQYRAAANGGFKEGQWNDFILEQLEDEFTLGDLINTGRWDFRLKPRTITINGVELNQCYSVAIDFTKNEVKVEFKNRNDAEALHDVISKLYGFK